MKENEKNPVMNMADQTMRNYEQAFQTGLKFQEEAWQRYRTMFDQAAFAQEAQKRFSDFASVVDEVMPVAQKSVEEIWGIIGETAQSGADLMKKAAEAAQTPAIEESQAKWVEFMKMSLRATRSNADAMMHLNTQAVDSMIDLMQMNIKVPQPKAEPAGRSGKP